MQQRITNHHSHFRMMSIQILLVDSHTEKRTSQAKDTERKERYLLTVISQSVTMSYPEDFALTTATSMDQSSLPHALCFRRV